MVGPNKRWRRTFGVEHKTFDITVVNESRGRFLRLIERGRGYLSTIFLEAEQVGWAATHFEDVGFDDGRPMVKKGGCRTIRAEQKQNVHGHYMRIEERIHGEKGYHILILVRASLSGWQAFRRTLAEIHSVLTK